MAALLIVVAAGVAVLLMTGNGASIMGGAKVLFESRAVGTHPLLRRFLDQWKEKGPFDIAVQPHGGLRTEESLQQSISSAGASKASTLDKTAHGRGCAIDVAPADYDPRVKVDAAMYSKFQRIATFAGALDLRWGGTWMKAFPPSAMNPYGGDLFHLEVENWAAYPFPPTGAFYA